MDWSKYSNPSSTWRWKAGCHKQCWQAYGIAGSVGPDTFESGVQRPWEHSESSIRRSHCSGCPPEELQSLGIRQSHDDSRLRFVHTEREGRLCGDVAVAACAVLRGRPHLVRDRRVGRVARNFPARPGAQDMDMSFGWKARQSCGRSARRRRHGESFHPASAVEG